MSELRKDHGNPVALLREALVRAALAAPELSQEQKLEAAEILSDSNTTVTADR
jgi:hypothetical protein